MQINGKVHCFFEQSGTFKNEFIKLGIPAEDYDLQNNFGETDHQEDLFKAIEDAYDGKPSIFDTIVGGVDNDLIMAFFPCIYFCAMSQSAFCFAYTNYRQLQDWEKVDKIIEREKQRDYYLTVLLKFIQVCLRRGIRMMFENPLTMSFLTIFFIKEPDVKDTNRRLRGDYYAKPTGYWYFNCQPTHGYTEQKDKAAKRVHDSKGSNKAGQCSEERSMISPDYARNFICDFILGKEQLGSQLSLF
jgi:hypothetical protein